MTDPAEIRAEGRRLLAEYREGKPQAWLELDDFLWKHADVLLADPAPVGLTEDEAEVVRQAREAYPEDDDPVSWTTFLSQRLLAIIDRLSAAPVDDREARWRRFHPSEVDAVPVSPSVDPEEKP